MILVLALVIDLAFGELPDRIHPVAWMGKVIALLERVAPREGVVAQLLYGVGMALVVPTMFAAGAVVIGWANVPAIIETLLATLMLKTMFALRALGDAGMRVKDALVRDDIEDARAGMRSLCSRDASKLEEPALIAATVESVAENASDSFVAPLFYYVLFGLPGAVFYRAVNTMDAMIGYHGKYEYLGKAAARLDDLLNFVPARITAGVLLLAGVVTGHDARNGWRILRRDGGVTESPNAGRPMAAMAGLLRVELAKEGHYRLGDPRVGMSPGMISEAWRMVMVGAGIVAIAAVLVLRGSHGHLV